MKKPNQCIGVPDVGDSLFTHWCQLWQEILRHHRYAFLVLILSAISAAAWAGLPKPTIQVNRTPATLTVGKSFTTQWSSSNADSVTVYCTNGGPEGSLELNGSMSGVAKASWVANPPVCSWSASNEDMTAGYSETLTTVDAPANTNEASVVSYSIPSTMIAGETYRVSLTYQNTGNTTWTPGGNYMLGSQNPENNWIWGVNRVAVNATVAPSQQYTFSFSVVAPAAGKYSVQWKMVSDQWFGEHASSTVTVVPATNNAQIIAQSVTGKMINGQSYPASIKVKNTGNTIWFAGGEYPYRLGSATSAHTAMHGIDRVALLNDVPPGGEVVFNFTVIPHTPGNHSLQWRMLRERVEWFGDSTQTVSAVVEQALPTVAFTEPASDLSVTATNSAATVKFEGTASPANGATMRSLKLQTGGVVFAEGTTSVSAVKSFEVGTHVVELVGTDNHGLTSTASRTVTVSWPGEGSSDRPIPVTISPRHLNNPDAGTLPGSLSVGMDGAANYRIDVVVPPGTGGMQPRLSLNYSSNGSNGLVGVGWTLGGLSSIHRCPKTIAEEGFPGRISFDTADRLCLDGQKLFQANGVAQQDASYWSMNAQFRTEMEKFDVITRLDNGGYRVEGKDGLIKYYGVDPHSAIKAQGRNDGQTLVWALAKVEDRSGNYYAIDYYQDGTTGEYLPKQIRYGGNGPAGQEADLAVQFDYELRSDAQIQYMGGSRNDLRNRLTHVRTFIDTDSNGNGGSLVHDYEVHYKQSSSSGRSMVDWIQVSARNPVSGTTEYLPKTTFAWGDGGGAQLVVGEPFKLDVLNDGETRAIKTFKADIDGSGRSSIIVPWFDLLTPNGRIEVLNGRLLGRKPDGGSLNIELAFPSTKKIYTEIVAGDLNGDGRDDLILVSKTEKQFAYCLAGESVNQDEPGFLPCVDATAAVANKDLLGSSSPPAVLSLRNDGKAQVLWFNARTTVTACELASAGMSCSEIPATMSIPANLPAFGFAPIELSKQGMTDLYSTWHDSGANTSGVSMCNYLVTGINCRNIASWSGTTSPPVVGDLNGDALTDFAYYAQNFTRCFSTEAGLDCTERPMPGGLTGRPFLGGIADSIGDGVQRLLFIANDAYHSCRDSVQGWVCQTTGFSRIGNSSGGMFSEPIHETITIDGSGVPAELTCNAMPESTTPNVWQRNCFIQKIKTNAAQDRIVAAVNGLGFREEVDYARGDDPVVYRRLARIDGVDRRPVYPQLLAHAGVMAKQLRRDNGQGGWLKTDYHYQGAMRDAHGRGSLGFGLVQSIDHQSGITTTSTFSQNFPFVGTALTTRRATAHCNLEEVFNTPSQQGFALPNGGRTIFTYVAESSTTRRDLDCSDFGTTKTVNEYTDGWGNLNVQTVTSSGGGKSFTSRTATNYMTGNARNYLSALPTSVAITRTDPDTGSITRTVGYSYDATSGLKASETVEPGDSVYRLMTTFDRSGNHFGLVNKVVQAWDDPSCSRQGWPEPGCQANKARTVSDTQYDAKGRFPISVKNALGHESVQTFSPQTGVRTANTDPNKLTTRWTLDAFGRVLAELRPDGNETRSYLKQCMSDCPPDARTVQLAERFHGADRIAAPQMTYLDSAGRVLRTVSWGFGGETIVTDQRYDSKGRLHEIDRPRFEGAAAYLERRQDHDDLDRVVSTTSLDERGSAQISTSTFQGLTVSHTNARQQIRIERRDILGQIRQVIDSNKNPGPGTTSFDYDAFGNLTKTIDPNGNVITVIYDKLGRRTALRDPDLGIRGYDVDPLGQVYAESSPIHPAGTKTWIVHDMLGRMTGRYEPELISRWVFDTAPMGIGQLAESYTGNGGPENYRRTHTYDAFGRPLATTQRLTDTSYVSQQSYDLWGRVTAQRYQRGTDAAKTFGLRYNGAGHFAKIERGGLVLWEATAQDASLRALTAVQGNGLTQTRAFNRYTGRLDSAQLVTASQVARLQEGYAYDELGNVRHRSQYWDEGGFDEFFTYDSLNRLETSKVGTIEQRYTYDAAGNILTKSGVGTYTYPAQGVGAVRPHAVQSVSEIAGGFTYDSNGNLLAGAGRTATWTTFDMPMQISKGSVKADFSYGPERQRVRQIRSDGTTIIYAGAQEVELSGGNVTVKTYWPQGIGVEIDRPSASGTELNWTQLDRLGSPVAMTDAAGTIREKLEYDAWGKRRSTVDNVATPDVLDGTTDNRGFTGHEMLDQLDLVHMNGRVYDPAIGKFMSADPIISDPMNGQRYNRYSYVLNNPTNLTDPTGFAEVKVDKEREKTTTRGGGDWQKVCDFPPCDPVPPQSTAGERGKTQTTPKKSDAEDSANNGRANANFSGGGAAERGVEQHRAEVEGGNGRVYEPLQPLAIGVTSAMLGGSGYAYLATTAAGRAALAGAGVVLELEGASEGLLGGGGIAGKAAARASTGAENVNAMNALASKVSALQSAQASAAVIRNLPDGRIRYYEAERLARTFGPSRGSSYVTEWNPSTGSVRSWNEVYDHAGAVNRVHPKMINGQTVNSQHYPPTAKELGLKK